MMYQHFSKYIGNSPGTEKSEKKKLYCQITDIINEINEMFHYFRFDLISDCWEEAYDLRPSFEDLKIRIKKLKDGDEV